MTLAEHLRAARKLITPEGAWTQRAAARDRMGREVDCRSISAECWCVSGAIDRVSYDKSNIRAWLRLLKATGFSLIEFNDAPGRTQAEVLAALDKAIELAEAGQ